MISLVDFLFTFRNLQNYYFVSNAICNYFSSQTSNKVAKGVFMTIDIVRIIFIVVFASLAYWVNEKLDMVPALKPIVSVIIVVIAVLALLASLFTRFQNLPHININ